MANGYVGKILRIDLTNGKTEIETPSDEFYRTYFGGRGLVSYYLLNELSGGVDPLSPENVMVFSAGPLCGTPIAGQSRNSIGAKSPLTGGYGDGEMGGYWGQELKRAGFDAMIIKGKAPRPVYVFVRDGAAEIRDASHLWGKATAETETLIRQEAGDDKVRVAQIGPAGEKLVRFACVLNERTRAVGRTGMGAVMGSKNLKAVAVKGTGKVGVAEPDKIRELGRWMAENYKTYVGPLGDLGTARVLLGLSASGGLPTRNFSQGSFEHAEKISGERMKETVLVGRETCFGCPIRCKRVVKADGADPVYGGPEYEALASLGSCCGIDDLVAVCKANAFCNAMGMDVISAGVTIAFVMECVERGILKPSDLDGLELRFGNADAMLKALELIAKREGIGNDLAEGTWRLSQKIGGEAPRFAMCIKGQEVPMHEPRLKRGLSIGYAVSPTGADHNHNIHDPLYSNPKSRDVLELSSFGIHGALPIEDLGPDKVRLAYHIITWRTFLNCAPMCIFVPWSYNQVADLVRGVTGWNVSLYELFKVGERAIQLSRAFNIREGFGAKDDVLPERFSEPLTAGTLKESAIKPEVFAKARATYYGMVGWDERGVPRKEKLQELGIGWVWDKLEQAAS